MTREREEWLKERKTGIGGSDVAAVIGLNKWRSPLDVFLDKTGQSDPIPENEAMHFGTILEDVVAQEFARRTGKSVERDSQMHRAGRDDFQIANIDRMIVGENALLECKTANAYSADDWGESQESEIVAGNVVTGHKIPVYYESQIQWYMGITKSAVAYVAVLIGGQDFRIYKVDFNEELYRTLVDKCEEFWFNNVIKNVPPDASSMTDVQKIFERDDGEMVEASNEVATLIGDYKSRSAEAKALKEEIDSLKTRICTALGSASGFLIGGEKACTFKVVNKKAYTIAASSSRQFRVY